MLSVTPQGHLPRNRIRTCVSLPYRVFMTQSVGDVCCHYTIRGLILLQEKSNRAFEFPFAPFEHPLEC